MTFVAASIKQRIRGMQEGGFRLVQGVAQFTTTGLTGDVDCMLSSILGYNIHPLGTPGVAYRQLPVPIGAVTATGSFGLQFPPHAGVIVAAHLSVQTTHATHDTNYWAATLLNKGAAGAGTADMILATDVNTTKVTGGSAITAYIPRSLSLHGTAGNLAFAANDYGLFTLTKAASAVSLVGAHLQLTLNCGDVGENFYLAETATDGVVKKPADGKLTFARSGANVVSGQMVAFEYWGF